MPTQSTCTVDVEYLAVLKAVFDQFLAARNHTTLAWTPKMMPWSDLLGPCEVCTASALLKTHLVGACQCSGRSAALAIRESVVFVNMNSAHEGIQRIENFILGRVAVR